MVYIVFENVMWKMEKKLKKRNKGLVCELRGKEDARWFFGGGSSFMERCDFSSALLWWPLLCGAVGWASSFSCFCSCPAAVPGHTQGTLNPDEPSSSADCQHVHSCPCSTVPRVLGLTLDRWYRVIFLFLATCCWSIRSIHWLLYGDFWKCRLTQTGAVGMWI